MARKTFRVVHPIPAGQERFMAVLPTGMYLNVGLREALPGSIVEFWQEWRHMRFRLVRRCAVAVNSSVFTFMIRSIYGERTRIADMLAMWEDMAVRDGVGKEGFDPATALLIEVERIKED